MSNLTFGERLTDLKKQRNIKQEELARILGVKCNTVSGYENGKFPPVKRIIKLAEYFNVSVDYLLGVKDHVIHDEILDNEYITHKNKTYSVGTIVEKMLSLDDDARKDLLSLLSVLSSDKEHDLQKVFEFYKSIKQVK